jgi:hypothetical protein
MNLLSPDYKQVKTQIFYYPKGWDEVIIPETK